MTKGIQPFADALYQEMLGHIKQTDLAVPVREGRLLLLLAHRGRQAIPDPVPQEGGRGRSFGRQGAEEILLDLNELAKGLKFLSLGGL